VLKLLCSVCGESFPLKAGEEVVKCDGCHSSFFHHDGVLDMNPSFRPSGFSAQRRAHLQEIEENHFWFAPRLELLKRCLHNILDGPKASLLELGCGSGHFLRAIHSSLAITVGVEGHPEFMMKLASCGTNSVLIRGDVCAVPLEDSQFDVVAALDVLEHVEPDLFLSEAFRLAKPNAGLLISVPAFPFLWGVADEVAGHRCRYRLHQIKNELLATGWNLVGHTYYQCALFPLFVLNRLFNRHRFPRLERQPPGWLNRLLSMVSQFEVDFLGGRTLPFGSSLIVWARKDGSQGD